MSQGAVPVDPDETVLRRIPEIAGYYDPSKAPPVGVVAFRPTPDDTDGLSFYLEKETSAAELIASGKPGKHYTVARMRAGDLYELGLHLIPDQQPGDLPGHLILPEGNLKTYNDPAQKHRVKEVCKNLSDLANKGLIDPGKAD